MKIGIMGAMDQEVGILRESLKNPSVQTVGRREYYSGSLFGRDAVIVFSRWGKVASASTATTLIDKFGVNMIMFTGAAGAISPALNIGDIVIAERLIQHDLDASAIPPFKRFEVPLLGVSEFHVNGETIEIAKRSAMQFLTLDLPEQIRSDVLSKFHISKPEMTTGTIASGDQFIADPNHVETLRRAIPNLQCVEMEGAAVAQVCYEHDIPFIVCRSISDRADHSAVIDFPMFVNEIVRYFSFGFVRRMMENM